MNTRHKKTLTAVFDIPTLANIAWRDIESLFAALGAEIKEAEGSRVCITLNGHRAIFHRPHPGKTAKRYQVEYARGVLKAAGVKP